MRGKDREREKEGERRRERGSEGEGRGRKSERVRKGEVKWLKNEMSFKHTHMLVK